MSLKVFRHKERDNIFLYWLFHLPQTHVQHLPQSIGGRAKVNLLPPKKNLTQLTFFQIPKILRARFWCMTSFTFPGQPFYLGFLFWHLWMTHPPIALVNTCAQACTQLTHALNRKVLSLTKPKGRIYKTKSLGHYITITIVFSTHGTVPKKPSNRLSKTSPGLVEQRSERINISFLIKKFLVTIFVNSVQKAVVITVQTRCLISIYLSIYLSLP